MTQCGNGLLVNRICDWKLIAADRIPNVNRADVRITRSCEVDWPQTNPFKNSADGKESSVVPPIAFDGHINENHNSMVAGDNRAQFNQKQQLHFPTDGEQFTE